MNVAGGQHNGEEKLKKIKMLSKHSSLFLHSFRLANNNTNEPIDSEQTHRAYYNIIHLKQNDFVDGTKKSQLSVQFSR